MTKTENKLREKSDRLLVSLIFKDLSWIGLAYVGMQTTVMKLVFGNITASAAPIGNE
jgi:hypothetical protein